MATLTINVPDNQLARVTEALCVRAGVQVSPANARQVLIGWARNEVAVYWGNRARKDALDALPPVEDPGLT